MKSIRYYIAVLTLLCSLHVSGRSMMAQTAVDVPWTMAHSVPLERLSVLLTYGTPHQITLSGSPLGQVMRYTTSTLDAVPQTAHYDPTSSVWVIDQPTTGAGYYVSGGELPSYVYIVDYSDSPLSISSVRANKVNEDPCTRVRISWEGEIRPLYYYTPSGIRQELSRGLIVRYKDLDYSTDTESYTEVIRSLEVSPSPTGVEIEASLTDTEYTIGGDRWQPLLGLNSTPLSTDTYLSERVVQHATITLIDGSGQVLTSPEWERLSAPSTLELRAMMNEPVASRAEWRIDLVRPEGTRPVLSYSGADITHTLREAGTYTISLSVYSRDGQCSDRSFVRNITISESMLEIPNAFTPDSSPGVNDIFRVASRSLVEFDARVYSRTGQELYRWRDPSGGWDGRHGGRMMPTGAYLYIITALGSDGVKYQRSGTINLIGADQDYGY